MERWHDILMRLSGFEGLVNSYESATPEDVVTLKTIHRKLYECAVMAGERLREAENIGGFLR